MSGHYNKDHCGWHATKTKLDVRSDPPFYSEREIWWCSLGVNIGFEQDGTGSNYDRPVLVIRGFNKETFLGVALTGHKKEGSKWHVYLGEIGETPEDAQDCSVILSQIRTTDTRRLVKKITTLDQTKFDEVCDRLKETIFQPKTSGD